MQQLIEQARQYGIELTIETSGKFLIYQNMLLKWNERVNLTAITQPAEIMEKHFLDSLMLLRAWEIPQGARVIDVGTGAGFPGVPLKIARPDIELVLLDALQKRTVFLRELSAALGQSNEVLHARAEQAAYEPTLRERFHVAAARAVAGLPLLCELCIPFVEAGGAFLAPKGPESALEAQSAQSAVSVLGGAGIKSYEYSLPTFGDRVVYVIEKSSQTPLKYPRKNKQMTKTPL